MKPKVKLLSDNSLIIEYPSIINEEINQNIIFLTKKLSETLKEDIKDLIPGYHNIIVIFDCLKTDVEILLEKILKISIQSFDTNNTVKKIIEIPVCYDMPYALDLNTVCKIHNITKKELIQRHTAPEYFVYMIGFTPGFPYLGGMDLSISTPRKGNPRIKIPSGSVGIAGSQTGIYPIESPGGWQIIGRTPIKLFDPHNNPVVLIKAGQYIKFKSITISEFENIEKDLEV